jgi:hypothetical protein
MRRVGVAGERTEPVGRYGELISSAIASTSQYVTQQGRDDQRGGAAETSGIVRSSAATAVLATMAIADRDMTNAAVPFGHVSGVESQAVFAGEVGGGSL